MSITGAKWKTPLRETIETEHAHIHFRFTGRCTGFEKGLAEKKKVVSNIMVLESKREF